MSTISPSLVEAVKNRILTECASQPEKYDATDVERFNETDEMIQRYIFDYQINNPLFFEKKDEIIISKVTSSVLATLAWRKEIQVNSMKDSDFPEAFYSLDLFKKGKQSTGQLFLVFNFGRVQRLSAWGPVWINFIVHESEKMTQVYLREPDYLLKPKPIVFCDSSEIGMAHMDFKFILKVIPIFLYHYTQAFASIWLYELPMFSLSLRPILNASLPKKITRLVFFTDSKNVVKDLGEQNVPAEYAGKSIHPLESLIPVNPSTLEEVAKKWGLDENEVSKMKDAVTKKLQSIGKSSQVNWIESFITFCLHNEPTWNHCELSTLILSLFHATDAPTGPLVSSSLSSCFQFLVSTP